MFLRSAGRIMLKEVRKSLFLRHRCFLLLLAFPSLVFGATVSLLDTITQTSSIIYVNDPFTINITGPANSPITYVESGTNVQTGWTTHADGTFSITLTAPSSPASYSQVWSVGGVVASPNPLVFTVAAVPTPHVGVRDQTTQSTTTLTINNQFTFTLTGGKPYTAVSYMQGGTGPYTPPYPAATDSNGNYSFSTTVPTPPQTYSQVWNVGGANATPNPLVFTTVNPPPLNITSISPTSGAAGTSVTINGTNFGPSQGTSTVKFNGTTAATSSWSATHIVATVPNGATTGIILVTVLGVQSNTTFSFQVSASPPSITSISPTSGPVSSPVTITGTNFGTSGSVTFNGSSAVIFDSWTSTSIIAHVPGSATTGNVIVTTSGLSSNGKPFTVTPGITSLLPASGPPQMGLTVYGTNLGASQGTSTVTFNGVAASVIPNTWSSTSFKVQVPAGGTTGNVVVTVGGRASNGVGFTVASFGCVP